jgi:hypothetical protein
MEISGGAVILMGTCPPLFLSSCVVLQALPVHRQLLKSVWAICCALGKQKLACLGCPTAQLQVTNCLPITKQAVSCSGVNLPSVTYAKPGIKYAHEC